MNTLAFQILIKKMNSPGAPGWRSQLTVWFLVSAQAVISGLWDQASLGAPHPAGNLLESLIPSPSTFPTQTKASLNFQISVKSLPQGRLVWGPQIRFSLHQHTFPVISQSSSRLAYKAQRTRAMFVWFFVPFPAVNWQRRCLVFLTA